jgi:DNA (cytosine-5)-methyltransferase 1
MNHTQLNAASAIQTWPKSTQFQTSSLRDQGSTAPILKLLDLFCGAGGASKGYAMAGFDVTGIDVKHGKRYPFNYIRGDVRDYLYPEFLSQFDVIAASPPCQTFSATQHLRNAQGKGTTKVNMIPEVREALIASGKPYVIENVPGAPLINPIQMCGSYFGLKVRRHRLFESNLKLQGVSCNHKVQGKPVGIYGSMRDEIPNGGHTAKTMQEANEAMDIDWMIWSELVESIPPKYTMHIGNQIVTQLTYNNMSELR